MYAESQRFDQYGFFKADVIRQLERKITRMDDGFPKNAMHRRRRPECHGRVKIVHALHGLATEMVRDARLHAHAITHFQVADFAADLDHGAAGFMSQYHGSPDHEVTDSSMLVIVNVAATYPDVRNPYFYLMRINYLVNLEARDLAVNVCVKTA